MAFTHATSPAQGAARSYGRLQQEIARRAEVDKVASYWEIPRICSWQYSQSDAPNRHPFAQVGCAGRVGVKRRRGSSVRGQGPIDRSGLSVGDAVG